MSTFPSNLKPQDPIDESIVYNTIRTDIKYGRSKTRRKWGLGVSKALFALQFKYLTKSEMNLFCNFYSSVSGQLDSFTWVHPATGTSYTVRFAEDTLSIDEVGENAFNINCKFAQVI